MEKQKRDLLVLVGLAIAITLVAWHYTPTPSTQVQQAHTIPGNLTTFGEISNVTMTQNTSFVTFTPCSGPTACATTGEQTGP